jgi:RimJ/RimL family protein N-acetyltransferase
MCRWASNVFSLEIILGVTAAQNVASQRVLLRAGFARQKEETRRFQGAEQSVIVFVFSGQR